MPRAALFALVLAVSATAAPVPKPDPEVERIAKAFGTVTAPVGCKLSLDDKGVLTVKMEKARPPKKEKPDDLPFPKPTGASFVRPVTGEFTATVKFALKTDLAAQPDDTGGVWVGLTVEYPTGESAGITGTFTLSREGVAPFKRMLVTPNVSSSTNTGKVGGFRGKSSVGFISGLSESILGPVQIRARCDGKKVLLEHQPDGKKWETFDELAIPKAGNAKLILTVSSYHGDATELVIDKLEVK